MKSSSHMSPSAYTATPHPMGPTPPVSGTERVFHVGCPNVGDRKVFDQLVDQMFANRRFTNSGEMERAFEAKLCEFLNVPHCIPVTNATVGLQLTYKALELKGEVILPAFTFAATPHSLHWEGLQPVFADVDRESHTICPNHVESLIGKNTGAIVGVHLWGRPCDTDRLEEIGRNHNIPIVYDAAHAFGCSRGGQMVGNFGKCEVFSFHATKFLNTFEGGAIATHDSELAAKLRLMKNFGFQGMDNVVHLGTNAKMSEISAAMGLSMFARLDELLQINRKNYLRYYQRLGRVPGLKFVTFAPLDHANWHYIIVEVDQAVFGTSRDQVLARLHKQNVRARRYFYPGCHRIEPYRSSTPSNQLSLPHTERLCERVLCLPTGETVSETDVDTICDLLLSVGRIPSGEPTFGPPHFPLPCDE